MLQNKNYIHNTTPTPDENTVEHWQRVAADAVERAARMSRELVEAMDELERVAGGVDTLAGRLLRLTQSGRLDYRGIETVESAAYALLRLEDERDSARRGVCVLEAQGAPQSGETPLTRARRRGWRCFSDESAEADACNREWRVSDGE